MSYDLSEKVMIEVLGELTHANKVFEPLCESIENVSGAVNITEYLSLLRATLAELNRFTSKIDAMIDKVELEKTRKNNLQRWEIKNGKQY